MSGRPPFREAPPVRDLLARATWADLDRIAARYAVAFTGRRRDVAVERLAAVLERPEQLQLARQMLPETTAAALGLLMLLGSADDLAALAGARERLVAVRPELRPTLGRAHLANEVQTLQSLGLCFAERRRLVVPLEVLRALPCPLAPAADGPRPGGAPLSYAQLAYRLEALLRGIAEDAPVAAHVARPATGAVVDYAPQPLTPEAAAGLGQRLALPAADVVLLVALLESMGALTPVRGRWQVQPQWQSLAERSPAELLASLRAAWVQPRALSDVARTGVYVWRCDAEREYADVVIQTEAAVRALIWRWLSGTTAPAVLDDLAATLAALQPQLFEGEGSAWIAPQGRRSAEAPAADVAAIGRALVYELAGQLAAIGFAVADARTGVLTALSLDAPRAGSTAGAAIVASEATVLAVRPLDVAPAALRLIALGSRMLPAAGDLARYELEAAGLQRLAARGVHIADLRAALDDAGAQLSTAFRAQLDAWAARAGRVRLHRPLAVLVLDEDAPLPQILAAAGLADGAVVVGPGCALVEPERVDAALEQLRSRGFWPLVVAGRPAGSEP